MDIHEQVSVLADGFASCAKILTAIGDETRLHLILEMMKCGSCSGVRVGEITEKTNLSRPAVSHHLQIMKAAGIVRVRREGTKNYYYFDPETESFDRLIKTLQLAVSISKSLPDRSGADAAFESCTAAANGSAGTEAENRKVRQINNGNT